MKTAPECSPKWNVRIQELNQLASIQGRDALGLFVICGTAELTQDASSNRSENPVPAVQNHHANRFPQTVFDFAMALRHGLVPA